MSLTKKEVTLFRSMVNQLFNSLSNLETVEQVGCLLNDSRFTFSYAHSSTEFKLSLYYQGVLIHYFEIKLAGSQTWFVLSRPYLRNSVNTKLATTFYVTSGVKASSSDFLSLVHSFSSKVKLKQFESCLRYILFR